MRSEAKKTGISVHFGQLMTIASINFFELTKHLQKMKGRIIVYRGDCAKDEHGSAAVYQELGANPTSVQGLNACVAYGSLPGNCLTAADAIKAMTQPTSDVERPSLWTLQRLANNHSLSGKHLRIHGTGRPQWFPFERKARSLCGGRKAS